MLDEHIEDSNNPSMTMVAVTGLGAPSVSSSSAESSRTSPSSESSGFPALFAPASRAFADRNASQPACKSRKMKITVASSQKNHAALSRCINTATKTRNAEPTRNGIRYSSNRLILEEMKPARLMIKTTTPSVERLTCQVGILCTSSSTTSPADRIGRLSIRGTTSPVWVDANDAELKA